MDALSGDIGQCNGDIGSMQWQSLNGNHARMHDLTAVCQIHCVSIAMLFLDAGSSHARQFEHSVCCESQQIIASLHDLKIGQRPIFQFGECVIHFRSCIIT